MDTNIENILKTVTDLNPHPNDTWNYRHITLNNKLRVLLISDPDTEQSCACMNVGVGALKDPREFQGLAHFLEHMLFMGSDKYPDEAEYKRFIKMHGGSCNASTNSLHTKYHFEVKKSEFEGGLDRFSGFFTCPLLKEDCVDREINAVNSEASRNLQLDQRRNLQVWKHLSKPDSILNKYSTGNLQTLNKPGIRDALIEFYNKYYSADIMDLILYSEKSLDEI